MCLLVVNLCTLFCASKIPVERHHWLCVIYLILRTLFFFTCGTLVVCLSSHSFHLLPFYRSKSYISPYLVAIIPFPRVAIYFFLFRAALAGVLHSFHIHPLSQRHPLPPDVLFDGEDPCVVDDHRSFTPLFHDPPRRIRCPTCALDWFPRPQVLMYYIRRVVLLACCRAPYVSFLAPIQLLATRCLLKLTSHKP